MLYRIIKRLIENNETEGLAEKIDVFYATNKITAEEYEELTGLLLQQQSQGKKQR